MKSTTALPEYWELITSLADPASSVADPLTQWVTIGPEMARYLLDNHNTGNRNIAQSHAEEIASEMARGTWLVAGNPIRFDWDGRLIDGQHTLTGVATSGKPQRLLVVGQLDPRAQMVIDLQKRRSAANAIEFAFGDKAHNTAAVAAMAKLELTLAEVTGTITVKTALRRGAIPNWRIADWVAENPEIMGETATYGHRIATRTGGGELTITPKIAIWLVWHFSQIAGMAAAKEFFDAISTSEGIRDNTFDGDPRMAFRAAMNRMSVLDRQSVMPLVFGVKSWNLWRTGKELRLLRAYPNGEPAPLETVLP